MQIDFFKIKPTEPIKHSHPGFDLYVKSMEALIKGAIPESIVSLHEASLFIPIDTHFHKLNEAIPLVELMPSDDDNTRTSVVVIARKEYSQGLALYFTQMVGAELHPTRALPITFFRSLSFKFIVKPKEQYYVMEAFVEVEKKEDLEAIRTHFETFQEKIRLAVLGVEHTRKVVMAKGQTLEEKRMILMENLLSLSKKLIPHQQVGFFQDVQRVLLKGIHENAPLKIPDHLLPVVDESPQTFDPLIFQEVQKIFSFFEESFASKRPLNHLRKVVSYLYLFQKMMTYAVQTSPNKRRMSLKLLPFKLEKVPTLSVMLAVNLSDRHEKIEEGDVAELTNKLLSPITLVPKSSITREEGKERIRTLYLEVQKKSKESFSPSEMKLLKKKLPKLILDHLTTPPKKARKIEGDEEILRHVLSLTNEINSIHHTPKMIIHYKSTSGGRAHFSVILARLQPESAAPLHFSSSPKLKIDKQERNVVGIIENRYIKEVYLFDVSLQEEESIAAMRHSILQTFKSYLPLIEDFNGGTHCRKYENLKKLKQLIHPPINDQFVENYFYSISPNYMQSLLPPSILKRHFDLLLESLNHDFVQGPAHSHQEIFRSHLLFTFASADIEEIEVIREKLLSYGDKITLSSLKIFDLQAIGCIVSDPLLIETFSPDCAILTSHVH